MRRSKRCGGYEPMLLNTVSVYHLLNGKQQRSVFRERMVRMSTKRELIGSNMRDPVTEFSRGTPCISGATQKVSSRDSYSFSAVRISKSDNIVFPDRLIIDSYKVVYYKGKLIGHDSTTILRENIGGVSVDAEILFADIVIETTGGQRIVAEGFSKHDAKTIQKLLSR